MPKINPLVLGDILVKYQQEIHQLYLLSKSNEISERLFVLHQQMEALIEQVESLICLSYTEHT
jgi:hypothetical protein